MIKGVASKNAAPFFCLKSILGTVWEQNLPNPFFWSSGSHCGSHQVFKSKNRSNLPAPQNIFSDQHSLRVGSRLSACTNRMTTVSHHQNLFEILWSCGCSGVRILLFLPASFVCLSQNALKFIFPMKTLKKCERPPCFCPIPWDVKRQVFSLEHRNILRFLN